MRWMWIDQIVEYHGLPEARIAAIKNVSLAEEHLHDYLSAHRLHLNGHVREPSAETAEATSPAVEGAVMPASLMIEGMAQTAGILVGSINRFREKVILAKVVAARFDCDVLPGQTIRYEAKLEHMQAAGASTTGIVKRMRHDGPDAGQWRTIGQVDLMFSHLDQNLAGLEFPEENFVFSENFRAILRSAGLAKLY